jgi:hypothetical protein
MTRFETKRRWKMPLEYRSYEEAKEKFRWSERWTLFDGSEGRLSPMNWVFSIQDFP